MLNQIHQLDEDRQKEVFVKYLDYKHLQALVLKPVANLSKHFFQLNLSYDKLYDLTQATNSFTRCV